MQTLEEKKLIEHIRFRPGMYLGILGNGDYYSDGIYRMFQEILAHAEKNYRPYSSTLDANTCHSMH